MLQHSHFNFCPCCGNKNIVVHQKNGMLCNDCGYVYFHNCASAVAAIIETPEGIVLTKRNQEPKVDFMDLPGGFSDYQETLEAALVREIHEELSVEITGLSYMASFPNVYVYKDVTYYTIDSFFTCKTPDINLLKPNDELSGVCIVKPQDIDFDKIAFVSIRNGLQKYVDIIKSEMGASRL